MASRVVTKESCSICSSSDLEIGDLAEVVNSGPYRGYVLVRVYSNGPGGLICLAAPNRGNPFKFVWLADEPDFEVRKLEPNEVVEIWNEE